MKMYVLLFKGSDVSDEAIAKHKNRIEQIGGEVLKAERKTDDPYIQLEVQINPNTFNPPNSFDFEGELNYWLGETREAPFPLGALLWWGSTQKKGDSDV